MKRAGWLALILAAGSLAGCGGYAYYAPMPPPPIRAQLRGPAPGAGFIWLDGYWTFRGGAYAWVPGYWARPPRAGRIWVPGHWDRHGNRYRFYPGRWR